MLEGVFNAELNIGAHSPVGDVFACVIDVQAPDRFEISAAKRRIRKELPNVRIKMMERCREPRLARPGRHIGAGIAIGIAAGIAMALIPGPLRPLAGRMRGAPG